MSAEILRGETLALWAAYAAAAGVSLALARRFVAPVPRRAALALLVFPLLLTGKAMLLGRLYGPADLLSATVPWPGAAVHPPAPANPILSDLAFANIPWRAAVRDAAVHGRLPFWNRFVLAGNPLLASAQAGIFHPATWAGILLPLPLSWTFSCTFTLFLGFLAGYLFFRDLGISDLGSLVGAAGWGLSTYLVFWNGWSVGTSTATFPLLLLGLRRLAKGDAYADVHKAGFAIAITVTSLLLSLAGGHPESLFHSVAAGGVFFAAELLARRRQGVARRALGGALAAGALALLLAGPQLLPLLEAIPRSAEYRARRAALDAGRRSQSVDAAEAASRLVPAVLPFAHGIYGKSPVQAEREDGSGMPLAYAGAVLFPLAALGAARRREGRALFAACLVCGLLLGASAPGLLDLLTRLPGFALALNYRLVFLAGLGLAGLAALGADAVREPKGARRLGTAAAVTAAALAAAFLSARGLFRQRELSDAFLLRAFLYELVPVAALAAAAFASRSTSSSKPARLLAAALLLLSVQRGLELAGTYPSLPAGMISPPVSELDPARRGTTRVVALGGDLRPNAAALLGVEDVRGYESIVLDRFADTLPLWCAAQAASFNRVDDLSRPFLEFLGARFAVGAPAAPVPPGWIERSRSPSLTLFENPRAMERAFVPRRLIAEPDPGRTLAAMAAAEDFSAAAWIAGLPAGARELSNGPAPLRVRRSGPDLVLELDAPTTADVFVATSLPDWPGWRALADGGSAPPRLQAVNHAFVGVWVPPGARAVRLSYAPPSWPAGVASAALGVAAAALGSLWRRRRPRRARP